MEKVNDRNINKQEFNVGILYMLTKKKEIKYKKQKSLNGFPDGRIKSYKTLNIINIF